MIRMRRMTRSAIIFLFLFFLIPATLHADVKLKVVVVNPSTVEKQTTPIRYDLPKGIGPDQVTNIGDFEMKYDFDKGNYYLSGTVTLKPSEKKVFEVHLRDVWAIPEKELENLKSHTESLIDRLKKTKHAKVGDSLSKKIYEQLDYTSKKEKEADLSIKERINQYYENMVVLGEVKENIGMLENLVLDVGGIVEERVRIPTTLAIPVKLDSSDAKDFIELRIKVSNPSEKTKQVTSVKYLLPSEISPRYMIDRAGLEMAYDFNKECFYLYKDNVELAPDETREYVAKVKDIWRIPDVDLEALETHTGNLTLLLKDTEYFKQAKPFADKIDTCIGEIAKTQLAKVSAAEHIAYHRENMKLLQVAQAQVAELEKLVSQRGASPGVTVKWAETQTAGGPQVRRQRGYEGIDYIAKSIFRGKAPDIATTWRIIWLILGFLAVISGVFFALQIIYHRFVTVDILTGLYLRGPLIAQLQKEHDKAQALHGRYSLLMIDLDNFKTFNDTYGHGVGDAILRTVSFVMKQNVERSFTVGRLGGDEFIIVMPGLDSSSARSIGEKIVAAIKKAKIKYKNESLFVEASVGSATYPEDAPTIDTMLGKVDEAMYISKKSGGSRVSTVSR